MTTNNIPLTTGVYYKIKLKHTITNTSTQTTYASRVKQINLHSKEEAIVIWTN